MRRKHGLPENHFLFFLELVPVLAILVGFVTVMVGGNEWVGWPLFGAGIVVNFVKRQMRLKKRETRLD
jgi:hypothetical protein